MSAPELSIFYNEGWITGRAHEVKSGKEATVYCCEAAPGLDTGLLAAKVYRERQDRSFHNDAIYRQGRLIRDRRLRRAAAKGTAAGRAVQFSGWIEHEFATLCLLHAAGADVPRPLACVAGGSLLQYDGGPAPWRRHAVGEVPNAILMQFVGTAESPASHLQHAPLDGAEALPLFRRLLRNIQLWLAHDRVHADLSAFNVLYWQGRITVIDFPQAVDPRLNPSAATLLARDVENICRFFKRHGVPSDAARIAERLWQRYLDGEL